MSRALSSAAAADLLLLVVDCSSIPAAGLSSPDALLREVAALASGLGLPSVLSACRGLPSDLSACHGLSPPTSAPALSPRAILVLNKADLLPSTDSVHTKLRDADWFSLISCKTEFGIDDLLQKLTKSLQHLCGEAVCGFSRPHQRRWLEECLSELTAYTGAADGQVDLSAQHLRSALTALGRLTGRVSPDQLLDVIFADFCIGK